MVKAIIKRVVIHIDRPNIVGIDTRRFYIISIRKYAHTRYGEHDDKGDKYFEHDEEIAFALFPKEFKKMLNHFNDEL